MNDAGLQVAAAAAVAANTGGNIGGTSGGGGGGVSAAATNVAAAAAAAATDSGDPMDEQGGGGQQKSSSSLRHICEELPKFDFFSPPSLPRPQPLLRHPRGPRHHPVAGQQLRDRGRGLAAKVNPLQPLPEALVRHQKRQGILTI